MGSGVVFTALGFCWRIRGTAVGPGINALHTSNRRRHDIRPVLAEAAPVHINDLVTAPGLAPVSGNTPGPDGLP